MNSQKAFGAETREEYEKQYYIDNREKIVDRSKKRYFDNKEKMTEYNKNYRTDNKERISDYLRKKIKCECGCEVSNRNMASHKKTKKHLNLIQRTYSRNGLPSH